ncbi:MAG: DUF3011 domain-containing protein [Bdellovibrionota bacterium]
MKKFTKSLGLGACLAGAALFSFAASAQRFPVGPIGGRDVEVRLNTSLLPGERLPLIQVLNLDRGACGVRLDRISVAVGNGDRDLGELRLISNDRFEEGSRVVGYGYSNIDFFLSSRSNIICRDIEYLDLVNTSRARIDIDSVRASIAGEFRRPDRPHREREQTVEIRCESRGFAYNMCRIDGEIIDVRLNRKYSGAACQENRSFGFNPDGLWVDNGCAASFLVTVIQRGGGRPEPRPELRSELDRVTCESRGLKYNECHVRGQALSVRLVRQESSAECREGRSFGITGDGMWVDRGCSGIFDVEFRR